MDHIKQAIESKVVAEGLEKANQIYQKGVEAFQKLNEQEKLAATAAAGVIGIGALYGVYRLFAPGASEAPKSGQRSSKGLAKLTEHEKALSKDFVRHEDVTTHFDDIGGLESQIREVEELVIFPLSHPHLYAHSSVAQQATGVLLYGPPGTGKTMLARAIARTARANFISVNVADVQSKWFGETPKLVEAVFSLARKNSPCVIFVDEIDGVLSSRNDADMAHVNTMKTKFMECWDGLRVSNSSNSSGSSSSGKGSGSGSDGNDWVLVIGATNKPWALDPAVLRRMPRQIFIGLPDAAGRESIMRIILSKERADANVDLGRIAQLTEGYSGSDLKEVVRAAALAPIREAYRKEADAHKRGDKGVKVTPRAIVTADLIDALRTVRPTGQAAREYLSFQRTTVTAFNTPPPAPAVPVAPAMRAAPSTPKTPGPRGGSPGQEMGVATSPSQLARQVDMHFGPSAKANGLNLARAIEDVIKVHEREKNVRAAGSSPQKPAAQASAAAPASSALEAIL